MRLGLLNVFMFLLFGIFYSQNKQQPMMDCICYTSKDSTLSKPYYNPTHSLIIKSENSKVFSISDGIVSKIIKNDDLYTIIIRNNDLFYIYSNLASIPKNIKIDKYISKSKWLGNGSLSESNYSIELQIYEKTNILQDILKYVKCAKSRL